MKRILVISAHPDDESLGLGGTLSQYSLNGVQSFVLIFTDGESSRPTTNFQNIQERQKQAKKAFSILGIKNFKFLSYEDQKLDIIPLVELAKEIETVIKKFKPDIIFTHFWGDVNQDHRRLFDATLIATRATPNSTITKIICYEVPSSTEWGLMSFKPNLFVDIDKTIIKKINAIKQYKNEVTRYPHPRSIKAINNRANFWGSSIGIKNAEAFIVFREIIKNSNLKKEI